MNYEVARAFTRVPVHHEVEAVAEDGRMIRGTLHDISMSGLSIQTETAFAQGTSCSLRIELTNGAQPVDIEARGVAMRAAAGVLAFQIMTVDADSYEHLHNLVLYNAGNARKVEEELEANADEAPTLAPLHDLS